MAVALPGLRCVGAGFVDELKIDYLIYLNLSSQNVVDQFAEKGKENQASPASSRWTPRTDKRTPF